MIRKHLPGASSYPLVHRVIGFQWARPVAPEAALRVPGAGGVADIGLAGATDPPDPVHLAVLLEQAQALPRKSDGIRGDRSRLGAVTWNPGTGKLKGHKVDSRTGKSQVRAIFVNRLIR